MTNESKSVCIRDKFIEQKRNRMIKRNQNLIIAICGQTGTGKTYSAITIADEIMQGRLDGSVHIVFSIEEFIILLNSGILKKGDVVVFEEGGVTASNKNWQSKGNKNFGFILQTFRYMNVGLIITLPVFGFLDKQARLLVHTVMTTDHIDYNKELAYLKTYNVGSNPLRGKEAYLIFPKFYNEDGVLITMKKIAVKMPRQEILDVYEKRKDDFGRKLRENAQKEMQMQRESIEEKQAPKKAKPCIVCGLTQYRHRSTTNDWRCRSGHIRTDDPYK